MSVFFIKIGLITVGAEQDVRQPVRGSAHLFADSFQVNAGAAFNDKLIMDVPDDEAVPEGLHGIAEDVTTDGLDDILHEFRAVGLYAFPFLRGSHAFIANGFTAELIGADPGFYI